MVSSISRTLVASVALMALSGPAVGQLATNDAGGEASTDSDALEVSLMKTDWNAVDRALTNGGIPLGRERREQAIEYCNRDVTKLDRALILDCVFRTSQRIDVPSYGNSSPESIRNLIELVENKAIEKESRYTALCILALNLDDSGDGSKLESQLWSLCTTHWTPDVRAAYVTSLAYAPWVKPASRVRVLKELFSANDVDVELRNRIISTVGLSVGEGRCSLTTGVDLYASFLGSEKIDDVSRLRMSELMTGWVTIYQGVETINQIRGLSVDDNSSD